MLPPQIRLFDELIETIKNNSEISKPIGLFILAAVIVGILLAK